MERDSKRYQEERYAGKGKRAYLCVVRIEAACCLGGHFMKWGEILRSTGLDQGGTLMHAKLLKGQGHVGLSLFPAQLIQHEYITKWKLPHSVMQTYCGSIKSPKFSSEKH